MRASDRPANISGPDPIFMVIARHKAASAAFDAEIAANRADGDTTAQTASYRALWALVETEPTTLTGIRALLDHIAAHERRCEDIEGLTDYDPTRARTFLTELAESISRALARIMQENGTNG
jgi:hypothetical protein